MCVNVRIGQKHRIVSAPSVWTLGVSVGGGAGIQDGGGDGEYGGGGRRGCVKILTSQKYS